MNAEKHGQFLGLRRFSAGGHEAAEIHSGRSNCARLDELKRVQPKNADRSVGTADTSVRATSGASAYWRIRPMSGVIRKTDGVPTADGDGPPIRHLVACLLAGSKARNLFRPRYFH